jgi:predicted transcriptional regulator
MHRPFLFRGFKSSGEILESHLGVLEREVMNVVWKAGEINVREACELLESSVAYTTVMTTMDRLFKKRLLARRKVGRAFVYAAAATRGEMEGAVATELVQSLLQRHTGEPLPLMSSLVDAVSDRDRALHDDHERVIHEKRRSRSREGPLTTSPSCSRNDPGPRLAAPVQRRRLAARCVLAACR